MKILFPSLVVFILACAAADPEDPVVIDGFAEISQATECASVEDLDRTAAVGDVQVPGDSILLVMYPQEREVIFYGTDLIARRIIPFAEAGPGGVAAPVAAALVQDSLLYIADRARQQLRVLDLDGNDLGSIPLDFAPDRLLAAGGRLLVTPIVMGNTPGSLLHVLEADSVRSLNVPPTRYADLTVNGLGNMVDLESVQQDQVLVVHRFLRPAAYLAGRAGEGGVRRRSIPIPDAMRAAVGRVPEMPITEDQLGRIATPVIALAADRATGEVLYLTRSGRSRSDFSEKAIVRLDAELQYVDSYLLDVNATNLAQFSGQETTLVVDEEDRWYRCTRR